MTQATLSKKINKTTGEMQDLIQKSKRKNIGRPDGTRMKNRLKSNLDQTK